MASIRNTDRWECSKFASDTFPPNPGEELATRADHELPVTAALAVTIKPRQGSPVRGFCYIHAERALCFHVSESSGRFLLVDRKDGGFDLIELSKEDSP